MRVISEAEASQGEKLMMLVDNCYHFTHRTCFKKYAKKTMLTMTKMEKKIHHHTLTEETLVLSQIAVLLHRMTQIS